MWFKAIPITIQLLTVLIHGISYPTIDIVVFRNHGLCRNQLLRPQDLLNSEDRLNLDQQPQGDGRAEIARNRIW